MHICVMLSYEQLREALWLHLRKLKGDTYNWTIIATFINEVIVQCFPGQLESYPITINADNSVTLGVPTAVEQLFRPFANVTESLRRDRIYDGRLLGSVPLAEGIAEADAAEKRGRQWAAVLVQEGLSQNGRLYTTGALQSSVRLFEGVRAYWTHTASLKAEPDPRDQAGFFTGARFGLLESKPFGQGSGLGAIMATFNATDKQARERLQEAFDAGNPDMFGISINASGDCMPMRMGDRSILRVDAIKAVRSADLVADPAAGGRFMKLVAGITSPVPVTEEAIVMFEKKLKHLKENFPALAGKLSASPTEAEVDALLLEAATPTQPSPAQPATPPVAAPAPAAVPTTPATTPQQLTEADRQLLIEARVERVMAGQTLPEALVAVTRESLIRLASSGVAETALRETMAATVKAASQLAAPPAAGSGLGSPANIEVGNDRAHKLLEGLEDYFFGDCTPAVAAIFEAETKRKPRRGVKSFRRLYEEMTGDRAVSGQIERARLVESTRLLEALSVSSWAQVFGNVLNRRMLAEYRTEDMFSRAQMLCSNYGQPLQDLTRPQRLVRTGSYADLATIGERQPYPDLTTPGDEESTYTPQKRGGVETISREAILADDLNQIRNLPVRIAKAARRTLYKFIMALFNTNPTIYDSVALAAVGHANLITAALSATEMANAYIKLATQTDMSGNDKLGLIPKILVIHPTLHETAFRLISSPVQPVTNQNATEPNFPRSLGLDTLIIDYYASDTNNWWVFADPTTCPTIEVGFVNGQEEPELWEQNQPNVGSVFTADVMSWKVRHEYGGAIVDYRGIVGGVVA